MAPLSTLRSYLTVLWTTCLLFVFSGCNIFSSNHSLFKGEGTIENPYQISDIDQLQAINDPEFLDGHFVQVSDINASKSVDFQDGAGFKPIGDHENPFIGSYNGNGFVIHDLHLPYVTGNNLKGLFGYLKNAQLENITIDNSKQLNKKSDMAEKSWQQGNLAIYEPPKNTDNFSDIGGRGGLAAINDGGLIRNCHFTGRVGTADVGAMAAGLVGVNYGIIEDSSFEGSVAGIGLVNWNIGEVRRSHVSAQMSGFSAYGLVNINDGIIIQSSVDVDLSGFATISGLVRHNRGGRIESSYAIGTFSGESLSAGLVAINDGQILNSYSQISMEATIGEGYPDIQRIAGLVGENEPGGVIETSYAAGTLTLDPPDGMFLTGGVAAENNGEIHSAYWDREAISLDKGTGEGSAEGTNGLTTSQMTGPSAQENMPEFDWENVWTTTSDGYPILKWQEED